MILLYAYHPPCVTLYWEANKWLSSEQLQSDFYSLKLSTSMLTYNHDITIVGLISGRRGGGRWND